MQAAMSSAQEAQAEVQKLKEELKEERKLRLESTQRELQALKEVKLVQHHCSAASLMTFTETARLH